MKYRFDPEGRRLPIKLVAPLTDWKPRYAPNVWHVRIAPDSAPGLTKPSAVDVLQLRGMDTVRFARRLGAVSPEVMEEIILAIGAVVGYP